MQPLEKYPSSAGGVSESEHALISRWIDEAATSGQWGDVELGSVEAGKSMQAKTPEEATGLLRAALVQLRYWDERIAHLKEREITGRATYDNSSRPEWQSVLEPRRHTLVAVKGILRRALPLERSDIVDFLGWFAATSTNDLGSSLAKAVQRHVLVNAPDPELEGLIRSFGAALRRSYSNKEKSLGSVIEQLLQGTKAGSDDGPVTVGAPPTPAPAGHTKILYDYKCRLRMLPDDPAAKRIALTPDRFLMLADSPVALEHAKLSELLHQVTGTRGYHSPDLQEFSVGRDILAADPAANARYLLALGGHLKSGQKRSTQNRPMDSASEHQ